MSQKISIRTCLKPSGINLPGKLSDRKRYRTVRPEVFNTGDEFFDPFSGIKRILSALKDEGSESEIITDGTAFQDFLFGQTITVYGRVFPTDPTIITVVFTAVCKLDQPTDENIPAIELLTKGNGFFSQFPAQFRGSGPNQCTKIRMGQFFSRNETPGGIQTMFFYRSRFYVHSFLPDK